MMDINIELCSLNQLVGNLSLKNYYAEQIESIFSSTKDLKAHFAYYRYKGREAKSLELYNMAEQWFQKAIGIAQNQSIEENLLMSYFDLGELFKKWGRYSEALTFLQLSLGKDTAINENNYINYILIANIHLKMGDMEKCMGYIEQLFALEPYISEPRELSQLYTVRGSCNYNLGDYQAALSDYKKADEILAAKYPATDSERVSIYALLGGVEHRLNHYNESEHYYKLYVDGIKEIYGAQSLNYINAQIYLANAQGFAGHIEDGCNNYTSAEATLKDVVKKRLPYMNTAEREGFWKSLSSLLTLMTPYALKAELYQTEYTKTCYDALLLSKAFLLDSERSVYDIIQREGDKIDMQTYMSIASMNIRLRCGIRIMLRMQITYLLLLTRLNS
jgi:tetratricopeptide (TPR) repeat protein